MVKKRKSKSKVKSLRVRPTRIKFKSKSAAKEIELLQQGHVPDESKIGEKFKGKNKIIVS